MATTITSPEHLTIAPGALQQDSMMEVTTTTSPTLKSSSQIMQLPLSRIKRIIKEDPDLDKISNDAVAAVCGCTELFLKYFLNHAFQYTKRDRRKVLAYKDMANTVKELDQFQFLEDVIPQMVPVKQALESRKQFLDAHASTQKTEPKTDIAKEKEEKENAEMEVDENKV